MTFNITNLKNLVPKLKCAPIFMKSGTQSKLNMLIMNIVLEIDDVDPNLYIQVNLDPTQKFPPTFMKFGTHNKFDMLIMNIMLASV